MTFHDYSCPELTIFMTFQRICHVPSGSRAEPWWGSRGRNPRKLWEPYILRYQIKAKIPLFRCISTCVYMYSIQSQIFFSTMVRKKSSWTYRITPYALLCTQKKMARIHVCTNWQSNSTHCVLLCTQGFVIILLWTQLHFWMYTSVCNRMLCTQEYKADFIVEAVKAFSIWFGYSHHILTFIYKTLLF